MQELPLSHDSPSLIENTHLVLFRAPLPPDKPRKSLLSHRLSPPSYGPSRRLPSLYWRSRVRLPTGRPSWPTRRGTRPTLVLQSAGFAWLLPAGRPARSAYDTSNQASSGVQGSLP